MLKTSQATLDDLPEIGAAVFLMGREHPFWRKFEHRVNQRQILENLKQITTLDHRWSRLWVAKDGQGVIGVLGSEVTTSWLTPGIMVGHTWMAWVAPSYRRSRTFYTLTHEAKDWARGEGAQYYMHSKVRMNPRFHEIFTWEAL